MSTDISLPPAFEFVRRVRPFSADEIQSLAPYSARYEEWKTRHNIAQYHGQIVTAEAASELKTILADLHQWGLQQHPPFIQEVMVLTEQRRQAVVGELCRDLGLPMPQAMPLAKEPQTDGAGKQAPAKRYLLNWPEILDCLGRQDTEEARRQIRRLNDEYDGPIIIAKAGSSPKVDQARLVGWWNSLESRWEEIEQRKINQAETVKEQYKHGKEATVVPGIAGHIKKKRQS